MTENEMQTLASLIAAKMKKENTCCPLNGVTQEQADAIKNVADGLIVSRKTFWEVTRKVLAYLIWGLIGYGIIAMLAEAFNKR
jgi:hypothetical protein